MHSGLLAASLEGFSAVGMAKPNGTLIPRLFSARPINSTVSVCRQARFR